MRTGQSTTNGGTSRVAVAARAFALRPIALVTLAIVALAIGASVLTIAQFADQATAEADARQARHAEEMAGDLGAIFSNASRDLRLARLNEIYPIAVSQPDGHIDTTERSRIESGISYVAQRYLVDEICLIGASGVEAARWNGGAVASAASLSADERGNPFFAPAIGLPDDSVFITAPYLSPDSHRWVYGFATPILRLDGSTGGILHFEIPLQRLADLLAKEQFAADASNRDRRSDRARADRNARRAVRRARGHRSVVDGRTALDRGAGLGGLAHRARAIDCRRGRLPTPRRWPCRPGRPAPSPAPSRARTCW